MIIIRKISGSQLSHLSNGGNIFILSLLSLFNEKNIESLIYRRHSNSYFWHFGFVTEHFFF